MDTTKESICPCPSQRSPPSLSRSFTIQITSASSSEWHSIRAESLCNYTMLDVAFKPGKAIKWAQFVNYQNRGSSILENQTVTVVVDFVHKSIRFEVDGQSAGPARALCLTDEQMLLLRPTLQIHYAGDSAELVDWVQIHYCRIKSKVLTVNS